MLVIPESDWLEAAIDRIVSKDIKWDRGYVVWFGPVIPNRWGISLRHSDEELTIHLLQSNDEIHVWLRHYSRTLKWWSDKNTDLMKMQVESELSLIHKIISDYVLKQICLC